MRVVAVCAKPSVQDTKANVSTRTVGLTLIAIFSLHAYFRRSRLEAVPFAAYRHDVARRLRIIQLLPQPRYMHVHRARSDERLILPHARQQPVARKHLSAMVDQVTKQLHLLGGEAHD